MASTASATKLTIFSVMLLVLLSAKVPTVTAFQCYVCFGPSITCNPGTLTNCSDLKTTTCGKADYTAGGVEVIVSRTCGLPPAAAEANITLGVNECQTANKKPFGQGTICQCDTTGCNTASPSGPTSLIATLMAAVAPIAFSAVLVAR